MFFIPRITAATLTTSSGSSSTITTLASASASAVSGRGLPEWARRVGSWDDGTRGSAAGHVRIFGRQLPVVLDAALAVLELRLEALDPAADPPGDLREALGAEEEEQHQHDEQQLAEAEAADHERRAGADPEALPDAA